MSSRRISLLLLGLWLGASLFMTWVASHNFAAVDSTLTLPTERHQRLLRDFGVDNARSLLRIHSAELNRHYFYYWELVQLGLGLLMAVVLLFATNGSRFVMGIAGALLIILLALHFTITPKLIEIGRGLDLAGPAEMLDEQGAFANLHTYYVMLDVAKTVLIAALALRMMRRATRRRSAREVDVIDDADNGHVNR